MSSPVAAENLIYHRDVATATDIQLASIATPKKPQLASVTQKQGLHLADTEHPGCLWLFCLS